jgi:MoxR-like ATPase
VHADDVLALQKAVDGVHASDALLDYVQRLLVESRRHAGVRVGLSPRAGLALLRGARAHALLLGRAHVLPDDVQALFAPVAAHRLVADVEGGGRDALAASILKAVAVD